MFARIARPRDANLDPRKRFRSPQLEDRCRGDDVGEIRELCLLQRKRLCQTPSSASIVKDPSQRLRESLPRAEDCSPKRTCQRSNVFMSQQGDFETAHPASPEGRMRGNSAKSSFRLRELRGLGILARGGQIQRRSDKLFWVKSQSRDSQHPRSFLNRASTCDCEDYLETRKPCKHIFAVNFLLNLPAIILANR